MKVKTTYPNPPKVGRAYKATINPHTVTRVNFLDKNYKAII